MAVALLALFVALAGGAYAAFSLPNNSVTSKKVKNASLKPVDTENVIANPKGTDDVSTGPAPVAYPLSHTSWKQAKGEVDQVVVEVHYTSPASCSGISLNFFNVSVNGAVKGATPMSSNPAGTTQTAVATFTLPAPSSKKTETITAQASDSCGGGSENFTINSAKANVLAFR